MFIFQKNRAEYLMIEHSTGLASLDEVLNGIIAGDNIVWQLNEIDDFFPFVEAYCRFAIQRNKRLIYFRFARHRELIPKDYNIETYYLNPEDGFEQFITNIHKVIQSAGDGAYYIFDCYSELTMDCYSDRMLGNFFLLTCPELYKLKTITYFAILRTQHSYHAVNPIKETTQIMLDVYKYKNDFYIHPLKVSDRYSDTMFLVHKWQRDKNEFIPIKESGYIAHILNSSVWPGLQSASYRLIGPWDKRFMRAEELLESYKRGECTKELLDKVFYSLLPLIFTREQEILEMIKKYFSFEEIIYIWKRMIGTGMIGGKTIGMLLARAILRNHNKRWIDILEWHDSFFIGSDVYYSFLVNNDCWLLRQKQKDPETFLDDIEEAQHRILNGKFPDYIIRRFSDMLDYYGQSPIIVRSSSLLEDNFGNAFAGKYESIFCSNQGTHSERLEQFLNAVRAVYASSMSREALEYRAKRGVLDKDEQMALLVQRVSGAPNGKYFFPHLAGVGFSYNPYVWSEEIDPAAGMIRLVFGLGTRAVDRSDDDYTRVVALNAPYKCPAGNIEELKKYSQRKMHLLDISENVHKEKYFVDVVKECPEFEVERFAELDESIEFDYFNDNIAKPWLLNFSKLFRETNIIADIREMLKTLKEEYRRNVDIEFTINFSKEFGYKINLLQCRPLQVKLDNQFNGESLQKLDESNIQDIIIKTHGGVIGINKIIHIDYIVFVVPEKYGLLPEQQRYTVARMLGKVLHHKQLQNKKILLIGPGRWGTSMPALGIPVSFYEINTVSALCEVDIMHDGLVPDLSLGTHFFHEMVEMDIAYFAYFKMKKENIFNFDFFMNCENKFNELFNDFFEYSDMIKIVFEKNNNLILNINSQQQTAILYKRK